MKGVVKLLFGSLGIFIIIQFVHPARNKSGQGVPKDISKMVSIPADVQEILRKACYDCHSNNTEYPWYTYLEPFHWFMDSHIKSGKDELNFNEFGTYTPRKQQNKFRTIESSLKDGTMPLSSYTLIHRNAILSKKEKLLVIKWIQISRDSLYLKNLN